VWALSEETSTSSDEIEVTHEQSLELLKKIDFNVPFYSVNQHVYDKTGGGLRFGEMERDCLIAYGASMTLKGILLNESDKSSVYVCERCGLVAYHDVNLRRHACGDKAKVQPVSVAHAFKLLLQEMQSLNVAPRLLIKERV